ncbi:TRAP transporter large permease [Anoxynatronum buryatiense]|uniref:TRAP transporter, DctM subunit n=1 Tax=Anoxynatronum buryatiense TaxID=489973 RepID=A0AA45WXJ6_9CLOT|nr:TRAP transporter large permease [Anoxynatronum buryatiense]SMP62750.1 TRAP transporter, DctM subunit [Anoxynatronum buryatiense]
MSNEMIGLLGIVLLFVLILIKIPIGFSMIIVGALGYAVLMSPAAALAKLGADLFNNAHSYSLSVIPMFTLMGMFIGQSGLGRDLFRAFNAWLGHIRGGLSIATVVTCAAFAAVSGSVIATTATIATVAVPEMRAMKYKDSLIAGCVASGSTLGILIPPSSVLIIYGVLTEESIGQLLIAGILPGLMTAFLLALTAYIMVRINPSLAPGVVKSTFSDRMNSLKLVWPIPMIFIITMGGIYRGVFTPTEGGAIGAFMSLIFCLVGRRIKWQGFTASLTETAKVVAMLMIMLVGGVMFGNFLSISRIPLFLTRHMSDLPPLILMTTIFLCYFVAGFFMDAMAILVIFTGLFYPMVLAAGYNGIWYGVVTILMILIGFLTPPVGVVSVITASISKIKLETVFKGVIPFWIALIVSTFIIILFPGIATYLPNLMMR